jgi:hypothetical protein
MTARRAERMTVATLARLAVDEAARLCASDVERRALDQARRALDRRAWADAIRAAIAVTHAAGKAVGLRVRKAASGNRPRLAEYRAEVVRLALLRRAPRREVEAAAVRFGRTPETVDRAIARARLRIVRARPGTAAAGILRATIR